MRTIRRSSWGLLLIGIVVACGKQAETPENPITGAPKATFQWISKNVFDTRCVVCHNGVKPRGKVDLSSYASLMASAGHDQTPIVAGNSAKSGVFLEVSEQKMPPALRQLKDEEKKALHDWIAAGAPEKTPGVVLPPQGAPNPPQANYEWLIANALRSCTSCHGLPAKTANVDFTTYLTLLASTTTGGKALVPGNPEKSLIYHEVVEGSMPPARHGLTEAEVNVVRQWIDNGAKND